MSNNFTYEEISRQPQTWEKTINQIVASRKGIKELFEQEQPEEVIFTGCGTSFYISIAAANTFQEVTGITSKAVPASEIFLKPEAVINKNKKTLLIGSSRSGTTTEVIRAVEYVEQNNLATTLIVTGYPESGLAKAAKYPITLPHIQEQSVVMTSSFTNILLALQLVAGIVSDDKEILSELSLLPSIGEKVMKDAEVKGEKIGGDLQFDHYIYLGLGAYFGLACEGMLKMKEMTQVFCEAFNPLEFRHGPISVLTDKCQVILLNNQEIKDYEKEVINDISKYGANSVVIGEIVDEFNADHKIDFNQGLTDSSRAILYLPYLQYLAYFRTLKMGLNPDKPRNLTQVVKL